MSDMKIEKENDEVKTLFPIEAWIHWIHDYLPTGRTHVLQVLLLLLLFNTVSFFFEAFSQSPWGEVFIYKKNRLPINLRVLGFQSRFFIRIGEFGVCIFSCDIPAVIMAKRKSMYHFHMHQHPLGDGINQWYELMWFCSRSVNDLVKRFFLLPLWFPMVCRTIDSDVFLKWPVTFNWIQSFQIGIHRYQCRCTGEWSHPSPYSYPQQARTPIQSFHTFDPAHDLLWHKSAIQKRCQSLQCNRSLRYRIHIPNDVLDLHCTNLWECSICFFFCQLLL